VHTGPFGNIAHGCSSVVGDQLALGYADYVLTEAGFGADLGFEKFMDIKARSNGLEPSAVVMVATVKALKSHGGVRSRELDTPNEAAVEKGAANLEHLVGVVRSYGLPVVVAINHFPTDTDAELGVVKKRAEAAGAFAAVESRVFAEGGAGGIELAEAVVEASSNGPSDVSYIFPEDATVEDKVRTLAEQVYCANGVAWSAAARRKLRGFAEQGWGNLPVCMAKTHLSISHNSALKGRPSDYTFEISDVRASVGAGFIYPIAGSIVTMPGLPGSPRSLDIDAAGNILGL
jgi:formyltetrahydrofolate synthetase